MLAVINHGKYIKEFLIEIFHCTKHQTDQARKMQRENSGLSIPKKEKIIRDRMPQEQIEHFLEFLFSLGLLQDVAFGVNKIKFDNGEEQKVANAILMMKYGHTTSFYKEICQETSYIPMSDTSLWRVLHSIKPSQRKALAGLDNVTAEENNDEDLLYNVNVAIGDVEAYTKHQIQDAQQKIGQNKGI